MLITLTYFKPSGKYYSSGKYDSLHPEYHDWLVYQDVRKMRDECKLPGLVEGADGFNILVSGEKLVPALILLSVK